jgi:hypothetical protein
MIRRAGLDALDLLPRPAIKSRRYTDCTTQTYVACSFFNLGDEGDISSETSVDFYWSTRRYNPEHSNFIIIIIIIIIGTRGSVVG